MNARGLALAELTVVLAIAGVLATLVVPSLVGYARTATLQAGARELATAINLGRQIAISQNTTVCVEARDTSIRLRQGGCGGTVWRGPGTDGAGVIRISGAGALQISMTANVVFTNLGAASTAGTYTVTSLADSGTRAVVVAATGRVSVR